MATERLIVFFYTLLIYFCAYAECNLLEIEEINQRLDDMLVDFDSSSFSESSKIRNKSFPFYNLEFAHNNGEGELIIKNVSSRIDPLLLDATNNSEFISNGKHFYLVGSIDSVIYINEMDDKKSRIIDQYQIISTEKILTFKTFFPSNKTPNDVPLILVVAIEVIYGNELRWYKFNENKLEQFWLWPVDRQVKKLEYFRHKRQNRLIMSRNVANSNQIQIDIYGFVIAGSSSRSWHLNTLQTTEITDLKLCPTYDRTIVLLQIRDYIFVYHYRSVTSKGEYFEFMQEIKSSHLRNMICFHSGNINYLITAGSNSSIFEYIDGKFQNNLASSNVLKSKKIHWIQSIPLDTYRNEVLLLVQLKNLSIYILSWQVQGFETKLRPFFTPHPIDLSKIIVIPKTGFIYKNKIVRIETQLIKELPPNYEETKKFIDKFNKLMGIFHKQEFIREETERRIAESYLKHPIVNGTWNNSELTSVADNNTMMNENIECKTVWIGAINLTCHEFNSSHDGITSSLERINSKLNEINLNMNNAIAINTTNISSFNNIEIVGDLKIRGTISLENLTFNAINNILVDDINKYLNEYNGVIEGEKFFPSIVVEKLSLQSVNGIPVNQIIFDSELINYEGIDFSEIEELEVEGDLNFFHINNINWESLMKSVVRKSQEASISEELIVRGTINAEYANVKYLNNLKYPGEYIQKRSRGSVLMEGDKTFKKLYIGHLNSVRTINNIPISDFILLNGDTTLDKPITFHNLTVVGFLEINGDIKDHERQPMKRFITDEIDADIFIKRIRVHGNIQVIETINNKTWSDFDDLLIKGDDFIEIIGKKTFLGRVEIGPGLEIISQKINGHLIDEFMTLDTYQELPNLKSIDNGIKIDRLIESDAVELERLLFENKLHGSHMCLNKHFVFKVPPIVDKISADLVNDYIPSYIFASKLNESFRNVVIDEMTVENLHVNEVHPQIINGFNYTEFLMGNSLQGEKNDMNIQDLRNLRKDIDDLYEKIANGSVTIRNLTVTGPIRTKMLNGILLTNISNVSTMGSVIFEQDVYITNLSIHGLINGLNFSEIVSDAVLKTDENVVITGKKTFDKIICETLKFSAWNNRSSHDILDSSKHQTLTGPIIVKGDLIVEEYFDPTGKIGGIYFRDIVKNINSPRNETYIVNGDFQFTTNNPVDINNLIVSDNIQDVNFNNFIESVVFLDSDKLTLTGAKTFENSVSLNNLTISKKFSNIDLENYFRNVVRIDKPVAIISKVIFEDDIVIGGDLIIKKNLTAETIMGINFEELLSNAMYTNEPTIVPGTIKFNYLKIKSDIQVGRMNDIDMSKLVTLHQDQIIPTTLYCQHITVGKLKILGQLNGYDVNAIFNETFLLTGDQNVTGKLSFYGDVTVEDFDSKLINNFDPTKIISTDKDEIIVGNFIFNSSIVLNGNLNVDGKFNNANLSKWKNAVMINGSLSTNQNNNKQIISGDWIVHGNVHFRGGIYGNNYLNDVNVKELNAGINAHRLNITKVIRKTRNDLLKICKDLKSLKKSVDQTIYKYKYFEYFEILEFKEIIVSIHHFDYNNLDYLFVSFKNCHLDLLVLDNNDLTFNRVIGIANFGYIDRWISFKFHETIYVLTLGESIYNKSSGNVWKFINDELILVVDFGNATDAKKISNNDFFIVINGTVHYYSLEDISKNSTVSMTSWKFENKNIKFMPHTDKLLLIDEHSYYELKKDQKKFSVSENLFRTTRVTSFRVGIFQREIFVYYDKKLSDNYIFISNNNISSNHIVQTIKVNHPVSIRVINFDNDIENFLVFIENRNKIQIYEYKGIEGFLYKETIRMKAEKLYTFKLRTYPNVVKKNCLALLNKNRLTILDAKMYGEKLDIDNYLCTNN